MKEFRIILILTAPFLYGNLQSQNFIAAYGGNNFDEAMAVDQDANGHIYTAGYFSGEITIGQTEVSSTGLSDVFIVKTSGDPPYSLEWVFTGGGPGPDRGLDIAVAPDGSSCVTGFFSGIANFGATTLTATNNSQDLFVLKLSPEGDVEWARSFGSELGDSGFGIDFDSNNHVIVTGQFQGTIDFDGTEFTSAQQFDEAEFSFDTFILKLDNSGSVVWAKHGQNNHESKGWSVKTDNQNNVFVSGQFSDTLLFDNLHPNEVFSAGFVVKFDSEGNEQWFRRISSSQTNAYDLTVSSAGDVLVTGDNLGGIAVTGDGASQFFDVDYDFNIYVVKFSNEGNLQWLTTNGSFSSVSSRAIALDENDEPYITGTFRCRFEEYSLEYGTGIFYSAGWRDIFITKFNDSGERQWSRHISSTQEAKSYGITVKDVDNPIVCGSFENRLVVTNHPSTFTNLGGNSVFSINPPYCGDAQYGNMRFVSSSGNTDIFLTAPVNLSREPLDYFLRNAEDNCDRSYLPACVYSCADSLESCGPVSVSVNHSTIGFPLNPLYAIDWTSSVGNVPLLQVLETGNYYWTYERDDGCQSFSGSLFAQIYPSPQPTITDGLGINVNSINASPISFCLPDTVLLAGGNFNAGNYSWAGPNYIESNEDSAIYITQGGPYTFQTIDENGCAGGNLIMVETSIELDSIAGELIVPGYQPNDTISLCPGESFSANFELAPDLPFPSEDFIPNSTVIWSFIPGGDGETISVSPTGCIVNVFETGHFSILVSVQANCDTTVYEYEFPFYFEYLPEPEFNLQIEGANYLCPGDTATLYVTGADSDIQWSGSSYILVSPDTILAWEMGGYNVSSEVENEYGCSNTQSQSFFLGAPPPIPITMEPSSGIICPNDSVQLSIQSGNAYEWYGPSGEIIDASQTIYVSTPGTYFCVYFNEDGCGVESNTVQLQEYTTPFLVALPGNDICYEGEVELVVVTNDAAEFTWESPISSNEPSVIVTEPGVYSCTVSLCGITTTNSITIFETEVNAIISVDEDNIVCEGDSLQLTANAGMAGYEWYPGGEQTQSIWVHEPGQYLLYTFNELGCMGISDTVAINAGPSVALEQTGPISFCPGDSVLLSSNGTFSGYLWTPTNDTTPEIYATEPGTYQLNITDEFSCSAHSEEIVLNVYEAPETPETDNQLICFGSNATLIIPAAESTSWILGENVIETDTLILENVQSNTLVYYFLTDDNGCQSATDSILIEVVPNDYQPTIYGNDELCAGELLELQTDTVVNGLLSWLIAGSEVSTSHEVTYPISPDFSGVLDVMLTVSIEGCWESRDTVSVLVLPLPNPLTIEGNENQCVDETVLLSTSPPSGVTPHWNWNDQNSSANSIELNSTTPGDISVTITPELNGCWGPASQIQVTIHPQPQISSVNSNTPVCNGSLLTVSAEVVGDDQVSIVTPVGNIYTSNVYEVITSDTSLTGLFTITANNGYCETTESIWVDVLPSPEFSLGADRDYCKGQVAEFEINNYDSVIWNGQFRDDYYSITETQLLFADVYNVYGCGASDSVLVFFKDCDGSISNVFTPNNDGSNDQFDFNPHNYIEWNVEIFNRWGQRICTLSNYRYWDGINCTTGQSVSDGTYYYLMEYITADQRTGTKKGYIQVFK